MLKTPRLAECTQESFFNAMLTLSQLGLEPDGKQASLVPFKSNKKGGVYEVQAITGYQGLARLGYQSGMISTIHADVVCENDDFEYDRGEVKKHKIDLKKPRGASYAAYSIVKFKDGGEKADVMSRDEIEAVRKRSRAKDDGPWITDWNEMAKKTVFRRLAKWIPQSSELQRAAEMDDDQFDLNVGAVQVPAITGPSRADALADMLASKAEAPPAEERQPGDDDLPVFNGEESNELPPSEEYLSEAALDIERNLQDPSIDRGRNAGIKQAIFANKDLKEFERKHLLALVDANVARLKK